MTWQYCIRPDSKTQRKHCHSLCMLISWETEGPMRLCSAMGLYANLNPDLHSSTGYVGRWTADEGLNAVNSGDFISDALAVFAQAERQPRGTACPSAVVRAWPRRSVSPHATLQAAASPTIDLHAASSWPTKLRYSVIDVRVENRKTRRQSVKRIPPPHHIGLGTLSFSASSCMGAMGIFPGRCRG